MRNIYLPELLSIDIKNYTLYPGNLDFHFDFVKGVNLVLGGNGMGKTTFVNIIKFCLIGLCKKQFDYTRTYKDRAIIKRQLYPSNYFANRMDDTIIRNGDATVELSFRINSSNYVVERNLESGKLTSVSINGDMLDGSVISDDKYERLSEEERPDYLNWSYEKAVFRDSNLSFDDLVFFVNEILFFGESHKTVLWNESVDGRADVQIELFNKYFNEPDLDVRRQEAQRQARYYDSLSRHKSEDLRAINNVIKKMSASANESMEGIQTIGNLAELKETLENLKKHLETVEKGRRAFSIEIQSLQGEINALSLQSSEIDKQKSEAERALSTKRWERLHPLYHSFLENIQLNHLCPMCNHTDEGLFNRVINNTNRCFACGNELNVNDDPALLDEYKNIVSQQRALYQSVSAKQKKIKAIESELSILDVDFRQTDLKRREIAQQIREIEYQRSKEETPSAIQSIQNELDRLQRDKDEYQKKSDEFRQIEILLTNTIEEEIINNTKKFSTIFAGYAESFLGVKCELTYDKLEESASKRFYPIIDGKIRKDEEELSESQRFFIDHSFRMSILTFFYQSPSFYIVETPDSSLDISYENNAARVFLRFLEKQNSLIVTSNLNNSSFIGHLIQDESKPFAMVGLLDIAKQSTIQNTSEPLKKIYSEIKSRVRI